MFKWIKSSKKIEKTLNEKTSKLQTQLDTLQDKLEKVSMHLDGLAYTDNTIGANLIQLRKLMGEIASFKVTTSCELRDLHRDLTYSLMGQQKRLDTTLYQLGIDKVAIDDKLNI